MSTEDAPFSRSQATHWRRQSYYSLFYGSFFEVSPLHILLYSSVFLKFYLIMTRL